MAGRARGAIGALLDFFAPLFLSGKKVERTKIVQRKMP
jgi:hypothetical protein